MDQRRVHVSLTDDGHPCCSCGGLRCCLDRLLLDWRLARACGNQLGSADQRPSRRKQRPDHRIEYLLRVVRGDSLYAKRQRLGPQQRSADLRSVFQTRRDGDRSHGADLLAQSYGWNRRHVSRILGACDRQSRSLDVSRLFDARSHRRQLQQQTPCGLGQSALCAGQAQRPNLRNRHRHRSRRRADLACRFDPSASNGRDHQSQSDPQRSKPPHLYLLLDADVGG